MPDDTVTKKSKRDRFVEIAERRTRRILRDLRLLGNCANRSAYAFEERDIDKIFSEVESELAAVKARFKGHRARKEDQFKLDK